MGYLSEVLMPLQLNILNSTDSSSALALIIEGGLKVPQIRTRIITNKTGPHTAQLMGNTRADSSIAIEEMQMKIR
jgi:hypothetical protein